jgi:diketogulonate reductase-like aldo/keto reductase
MKIVSAHGAHIPAIGFGTWPMRGDECRRAVSAALEAGYRHIDTAAGYGNEREVGEAIRGSGLPRNDIFVTTKISPSEFAEGRMQRAAEAGVRNLAVDQVDLILLHWPSHTIPAADAIRTLNDVKRRGMTRHIGVSNFTTKLLAEAWAATEEPIAVNQCEYHPHLNQDRLIADCRARGMAFTAYAPIGRGEVLGDPKIKAIAERLGKTPAQIIVRWLIQQDGIVAIPKSANPRRIRENFDVFGFELSPADMAAIHALARRSGRVVDPSDGPDWDP